MVESCIIALVPGTFEGLLAVAMVLVYVRRRVVNVSLPAMGALGAYLMALLAPHTVLVLALSAGLALTVLTSVSISAAASWQRTSIWNQLPLLVTLLGAVVVEQGLTRFWKSGLEFPELLPQRLIVIARYQVTPLQVAGVAAGGLAVILAIAVIRIAASRDTFPRDGYPGRWVWVTSDVGTLVLAGVIAFVAAVLAAEAGFGPGYMVAPAIVASLAAAVALFHRPAIAFLAAVTIEVARNLSVRWAVPHAGYTSGVAVVLLVAAAFYASRYLVLWRMRPG